MFMFLGPLKVAQKVCSGAQFLLSGLFLRILSRRQAYTWISSLCFRGVCRVDLASWNPFGWFEILGFTSYVYKVRHWQSGPEWFGHVEKWQIFDFNLQKNILVVFLFFGAIRKSRHLLIISGCGRAPSVANFRTYLAQNYPGLADIA